MILKNICISLFLSLTSLGALGQSNRTVFTTNDYVKIIHSISEVMIHDIVAPTGASRYYAYVTIAGYEILSKLQPDQFPDLNNKLNNFPNVPSPKSASKIDLSFTVIYTTVRMGEELLPSGFTLDSVQNVILKKARSTLGNTTLQNSISFSDSVVASVLYYANSDHYREINGLTKYTPKKSAGSWKPTPPSYISALDPYWNRVRPFTLDSASQFKPAPYIPYSDDSTSAFFHEALEVYTTGKNLSEEQRAIADFWDCNPFAVQQAGHIDYALKKISPAGHWMSITGLACLKKNLPLPQTIQIYTVVAVAMADGFISCWDEKYRSNRIRPETYINEKIDRNWLPMIQTPPFPEYTSGHSVASGAAAVVLTKMIGDNFKYTDNTEEEFSLPARTFSSFNAAAAEATISRLYGGIHFRDALENGSKQGREIGNWVLDRMAIK